MDGPISVLIVDDDFYARDAMRALLSRDRRMRVWDVAEDVEDALRRLASHAGVAPDVVLLDVRLGEREQGGIEGVPLIKQAAPSARVLMTSVANDEDTVLAAVRAGADGYVWKNESADGIANAIERLSEGRFVVTRSIAERLLGKTVELGTYAAEIVGGKQAYRELTEAMRKTVYLYCFCGMSAREIAEELQVSANTVNSRIKVAYQVLEATTRGDAFQRLVEAGGIES